MSFQESNVVWLPRGFEFLSGLPEAQRRRRIIMNVQQLYIDDSGTKGTGKVLMLGGLLGSAEAHAIIAERWEKELRAHIPLPIEYFKCSEARNLSGAFAHWHPKRRDEKVIRLAAVLDRDDVKEFFCAVDLGAHRPIRSYVPQVDDGTRHHSFNQPYFMAFLTVMIVAGLYMAKHKPDEKIEVIADDHDIFRQDLRKQYELARKGVPEQLLKHLPVEPLFRNDRDFVMLQAADLLMGHARMYVEGQTTKWPKLEWKKLKVLFSHVWAAEECAQITAQHLARVTGLPASAFPFTVVRPAQTDWDDA